MIYYFSNSRNVKDYVVLQELDKNSGYILAKTDEKIEEYEPIILRHTILYSIVSLATILTAMPVFSLYDKIKKGSPIKKFIKSDKNQDIVRVSPKFFFEHKAEVEKFILKLIKNKRKFDVILDGNAENLLINGNEDIEYNYSGKQILELWEFNKALKMKGMKNSIRFNEFHETETYEDLDKSFSLEQVIEANHQIDEIVNTIKSNNFSPYEAMVYIHKFLTTNFELDVVQAEVKDYNKYHSIVSALQNKKTVCVGFASLTKAIIDKLNMPGLSCTCQNVQYLYYDGDEQNYFGHALNFINIDDKKYDIKGTFANDAQADGKTLLLPNGMGYAHFMYPLVDLENKKHRSTLTPTKRGSRSTSERNDEIVWDAWRYVDGSSAAIPFEKTKQAITHVYSSIMDNSDNKTVENAVQDDIERTMVVAWDNYRTWAKNPFLKEIKKMHSEILPNGTCKITFTSGHWTELSL